MISEAWVLDLLSVDTVGVLLSRSLPPDRRGPQSCDVFVHHVNGWRGLPFGFCTQLTVPLVHPRQARITKTCWMRGLFSRVRINVYLNEMSMRINFSLEIFHFHLPSKSSSISSLFLVLFLL